MEEKKNGLSRRNFLINGSTAMGAIGLAAGLSAGSLLSPREAGAANLVLGTADFPIPNRDLNVEKVREYGYYFYQNPGGCGLGSARALIVGFLDAHAAAGTDPKGWAQIPLNLYGWCNGGGPNGWGTLCGSIAGSVGVLTLINLQGTLGSTVFEWYVKQNFPMANLDNYIPPTPGSLPAYASVGLTGTTPPTPIRDVDVLGHAVSDSPLCHVSVSKWLTAAGANLDTAFGGKNVKKDRCAKVTADTAAYTAYLLNEKLAGRLPAAWAKPAAMAGCYDCHDAGGLSTSRKDSQVKMDCAPCHTEPMAGHRRTR